MTRNSKQLSDIEGGWTGVSTLVTIDLNRKMYAIRGEVDVYPWDHWASAFGTAKAHQMLTRGVIVEAV